MSRPRPAPLDLTHPIPLTPPTTPDKEQHPTSPNQKASRAPTKSVRFALPTSPQSHHNPKSGSQTSSVLNTHYHRKPKPKTKRISTKPYCAFLNRLITRYYSLLQSLCEPGSPSFQVADNKSTSKISGIIAPPPSPVPPVRDRQPQTQTHGPNRKLLQALKNYAYASIYKHLTALAPVLTLPTFPSQEKEKEVRRVLKRAKRGLKVLEEFVTSSSRSQELGSQLGLDLHQKLGMEVIQQAVAMMSLKETRRLSHPRVHGCETQGLIT